MRKITYDFFEDLARLRNGTGDSSFILKLLEDEDIKVAKDFADYIIDYNYSFDFGYFPSVCKMLGIYGEMVNYIIDKTESFSLLNDIVSMGELEQDVLEKIMVKMFSIDEKKLVRIGLV